MTESLLAAGILIGTVALVLWKPQAAVMALGVLLFVQSAIIRLDALPVDFRQAVRRTDEVVLLVLALRSAGAMLLARRFTVPAAVWPLVALAAVGVLSAFVNAVPPVTAAVALFISLKAGLWLYVGRNLRFDERWLVRYGYLIGGLFLGAIVIAAFQFAGVTMPWEPHLRHSGELAATSIWNQHTVFGSALVVATGMVVVALRLPGERLGAALLGLATAVGVVLSSVRRLLLSLPISGIATLWALSPEERRAMRAHAVAYLRRPIVLVGVLVTLVALAVVVGPRMVHMAVDTWNQYVIGLGSRDRFKLYEGALKLFFESPLWGRGPGTYGSYASVLFGSPAYDEVGVHLRNSLKMGAPYAGLLAEYGLLGVIGFAGFVLLLIRAALPAARRLPGTVPGALAAGGIFTVVDMTIESVVHVSFSSSFVGFFVFIGIGAALSLSAGKDRSQLWDPRLVSARWRIGSALAGLAFMGLLVIGTALLTRA
jgi:hypothetical protein